MPKYLKTSCSELISAVKNYKYLCKLDIYYFIIAFMKSIIVKLIDGSMQYILK
jgi:hypothetical protein